MPKCPKCGHEFGRTQRESNLFHKLRDAYATETGYNNEEAKRELKWLYGVRLELESLDDIPDDESGDVVFMYGKWWWLKSEAAMTKEEHLRLTTGAEHACVEVGADIRFMYE